MKVERRLLSLVALLRRARGPVSRAAIVDAMSRMDDGYPHDRPVAARKKLQRDLTALRELGVVVRWAPEHDGYVLSDVARAPVHVSLDEDDAELLVEAVRRVTESGPSRMLAASVEGVLEQSEARELSGADGALVVYEPVAPDAPEVFEALVQASWRRRVVSFDYTTLDGRVERRTVEPWGLFRRERTWLLLGRDVARAAPRSFRLAQLHGLDVGEADGVFVRPDGPEADVARWARLQPWAWAVHVPVEVVLRCDEVGPLVARALGDAVIDGDRVRVVVTHLRGLDELIAAWSPRVVPEAPAELVATHRARLAAILARHGVTA